MKRIYYIVFLITIAVFVVFGLGNHIAHAANAESTNFTLTNDQIIPSLSEGQSSNFTVIGQNSPMVGYSESDSLTNLPVIMDELAPPITDRECNESCATDSNCTGDLVCYGGRCKSSEDVADRNCPGTSSGSHTSTASPRPTPRAFSRIRELFEELPPGQLFDIALEIDDTTIDDIKELVARVIFESFGTEPTPVDMTFVVENEKGTEIYRVLGNIVVETEAVFTQTFENVEINLSDGKYTLVLTTLYSEYVEDEFRTDFWIGIKPPIWQSAWYWVGVGGILLITTVVIVVIEKRKKRKVDYI